MDETTRMTVIDEMGEEREVRLLFTFETPDKRQFALFTSADDLDGDVYPYQYDEDGNIESQEFYDGVDWIDNPADIKFNSEYCDSDDQDDWIVFINDFMHLFETGELFNVIKTLKEVDDSHYFNEESIDVVVIEEDLI